MNKRNMMIKFGVFVDELVFNKNAEASLGSYHFIGIYYIWYNIEMEIRDNYLTLHTVHSI